jgi:hypothetical protein
MKSDWQTLLPEGRGPLTLGNALRRTDANGPRDAPIAILGVYPAATRWEIFSEGTVKLRLPVAVEERSFDPSSRSGGDLDRLYLSPLDLPRTKCQMVDLMPYFFANIAKDSGADRSMWDNVQMYVKLTGASTAIEPRPPEDKLLDLCHSMPGNQDRLASYLGRKTIKLLITLGREPAAYVRGELHAEDGQKYLYNDPACVELFGNQVKVVHFVHPGNLQRRDTWKDRHNQWCQDHGRELVKAALS